MVEVFNEDIAAPEFEPQKRLGHSNGKTPLAKRSVNKMSANNLRRSLKKSTNKKKKRRALQTVDTSVAETTVGSSQQQQPQEHAASLTASSTPTHKENTQSANQSQQGSKGHSDVPNKGHSPLRPQKVSFEAFVSVNEDLPTDSKQSARTGTNTNDGFGEYDTNQDLDELVAPTTPGALLAQELAVDPDMTMLELSPELRAPLAIPPPPEAESELQAVPAIEERGKRQPLKRSRLTGKAKRISTNILSASQPQKEAHNVHPLPTKDVVGTLAPASPRQSLSHTLESVEHDLDSNLASFHESVDNPQRRPSATGSQGDTSFLEDDHETALSSMQQELAMAEKAFRDHPRKALYNSHEHAVTSNLSARPQKMPATLSSKPCNKQADPRSHSHHCQPLEPKTDANAPIMMEGPTPEDWANKQCSAFTEWINYTFEPCEDRDEEQDHMKVEQEAFRSLVLQQRMASARSKSVQFRESFEMKDICDKVRSEIGRGRLCIREDRDIHADLSLRKQVLKLLFSYSTPWLRLGLETLYGVVIEPFAPSSRTVGKLPDGSELPSKETPNPMHHALHQFMVNRVLSDKAVLAKYTKRLCKVPSGRFGEQYQAEIRSVVLYRLMVLFFFLDRAKAANILDKVPRLFAKGAEVKSTKDLLLAFCRLSLAQEGDFIKHLSRMGLRVTYRQEPIDEIDFRVSNLAVDLRDGILLTRLAEILTEATPRSLLSSLRLPAVSRLQKLHNVAAAIDALRQNGVPVSQDILPHQIVDSHREVVLRLMWSIISTYCLHRLVSEERIKDEILQIKVSRGELHLAPWDESPDREVRTRNLLLQWCDTICSSYGVSVSNITTDFADGVVMCLLLNFYMPNLLRLSEIRRTARATNFMNPSKRDVDIIRSNERHNCDLVNRKTYLLGGMGRMIPVSDAESLPDPKSMLLGLAYTFSRIMDCSNEIRACITIQVFVRQKLRIIHIKRKLQAASAVLQCWREHKANYYRAQRMKYGGAVQTLESFFISCQHRLEELRERRLWWQQIKRNIVKIQSAARGMIAYRAYQRLLDEKEKAIVLQSWWRQTMALEAIQTLKVKRNAARSIQRAFRASKHREELKTSSAIVIQSQWRAFWTRVQFLIDRYDIIAAQSCARRFLARRNFMLKLASVIRMQCLARQCLARKEFSRRQVESEQNVASILIQSSTRSLICRLTFLLKKTAAIRLQSIHRQFSARESFLSLKSGAIRVQAKMRQMLARKAFCTTRLAAINIQARFRRHRASTNYRLQRKNVVLAQCQVRSWIAIRKANEVRQAATVIQSMERMRSVSLKFRETKEAAVILQNTWRMFYCRNFLVHQLRGSIQIQRIARGYIAWLDFQKQKESAIVLQSAARKYAAKQELQHRRFRQQRLERRSATGIQAVYRGYLLRRELEVLTDSATTIQTAVRCFIAEMNYKSWLLALTTLQAGFRAGRDLRIAEERMNSVLIVQSFARQTLAKKRAEQARLCLWAATRLQCLARSLQAKAVHSYLKQRKAENDRCYIAATKIQRATKTFLRRFAAARMIQKTWRCYDIHLEYQLSVLCIVKVQSLYRRRLAAQEAVKRYCAVKTINRFMYGAFVKIHSARTIQRYTRGFMVRLDNQYRDYMATRIQAMFRSYRAEVYFMLAILSASTIQQSFRMWRAKMEARRIRRIDAATKIQQLWKRGSARRAFLFTRLQIIKLQSRLRGHLLRRRMGPQWTKRLNRVKKQSLKAQNDPSQTLGARSLRSLEKIQGNGKLECVLRAMKFLETATLLSKTICHHFCVANASEILFDLIQNCNRSLPHIQLIQHTLHTLLNIAAHRDLLPMSNIATVRGGRVFLDLMQTFRDKESVFPPAVALLEVAVAINKKVKADLCEHESSKRLRQIHAIQLRKINAFDDSYSREAIKAVRRLVEIVDAYERQRTR